MKQALLFSKHIVLFALSATVCVLSTHGKDGMTGLDFVSSGAMQKLGSYTPQRITLSTNKPEGIRKTPPDLVAPRYGSLKLGPSESRTTFYVVVDEPAGKPSRLFVDANGNGDLTDDPAPVWHADTNKAAGGQELVMYNGGATLQVPYKNEILGLHIPMYRFDKNDPERTNFTRILFYYGDYARSGELTIGSKTYPAVLSDPTVTGDFRAGTNSRRAPMLMLDLNGDGKFDARHEGFPVNKPFNIGGTTYELSGMTASGSFQIVKSSETVPETKPMPNLTAGQPAPEFTAKTTDGKEVVFPRAYKGKVVLLDFWATWCGPCVAEMPNLTAAYDKFHGQGLEVLGISLDRENEEVKLASFTRTHNMPWAQVYDGKWWKSEVATEYYIDSIPHAFLVDGDTGKIIAEGHKLRGDLLAKTITEALAKKGT